LPGLINSYVSNVYAKPGEESAPGPGEINRYRKWSDGTNPGYRGLCFLGDPEWYRTGQLPADVLAGPIPPLPYCCGGVGAPSLGGLILGGSASFPGLWPAMGSGGLVLGGSASFPTLWPAPASGGLILGGSASFPGLWPAMGSGGVVLGGLATFPTLWPPFGSGGFVFGGSAGASMFGSSGSGSGSGGGGGETMGCLHCPDGAAAQYGFNAGALTNGAASNCAAASGLQQVTYAGGCIWIGPQIDIGGFSTAWQLTIGVTQVQVFLLGTGLVYSVARGAWDCLTPLGVPLETAGVECVPSMSSVTISPV
jgi:hypothetical protein